MNSFLLDVTFDPVLVVAFVMTVAGILILTAIIAPKKEKIVKIKSADELFEIVDPHVLKCKKCYAIISIHNRNYHVKNYHKELMKP